MSEAGIETLVLLFFASFFLLLAVLRLGAQVLLPVSKRRNRILIKGGHRSSYN